MNTESSEAAAQVFHNEMLARHQTDILRNKAVPSMVNPPFAGYGSGGPKMYIPYGLYIFGKHPDTALAIIKDKEGQGS
jgi:hypothetical protein